MSTTIATPGSSSPTASSVYVYWSYWEANSSNWTLATKGSGTLVPPDGSLQGWRYGAGQDTGLSQPPRLNPNFNQICASTPQPAGQKRVAVIVDPGIVATGADTPPAATEYCAVVDSNATGTQVLSAVASVRQNPDSMVCGVNNYPRSGCGEQVSLSVAEGSRSATPSPANTSGSGASWLPFTVGLLVILAIVIGAVAISRRKQN